MIEGDDDHEEIGKRLCHACIGEPYLMAELKAKGVSGLCAYCGATKPSLTIEELADKVETAFAAHYVRTAIGPDSIQERMQADRESSYTWTREGSPMIEAIQEAAMIGEEEAADVLEVLQDRHGDFDNDNVGEESEFNADAHYEEKSVSPQGWHEEWHSFEQSLKTEARYFSRSAAVLLARVFGYIDTLTTKPRRPLVVDAGPGRKLTHVYRARVFQSDEKLEEALCRPDLHLGSPPARFASAGRMNARGISVFYGANNAGVALAEVRPAVGSKVAIARFEIIRPLRLLDLTALDSAKDGGSIFDPSLKGRLERVAFLRTVGERMTRPVLPDDQSFDYLATQAIADFLATENEPRLDGVIFGSAQAKTGRNVVLFHKAARVEVMQIPEGAEITASTGYGTEDGWEIDYGVSEEVPRPKAPASSNDGANPFGFLPQLYDALKADSDFRDAALRVDSGSVEVHHVKWVKVNSTRFEVSRYRHENRERKF
jgi:hypothetical protein